MEAAGIPGRVGHLERRGQRRPERNGTETGQNLVSLQLSHLLSGAVMLVNKFSYSQGGTMEVKSESHNMQEPCKPFSPGVSNPWGR